ncbi:alpha-1,6-mannosyl-glycoprotein beta-1,2-N-acetylglucosaminyltransferase [Galdieria sulphuraria]|uniref:Alpha-1,6-mannosyl-glycoprotein 2-beta-N-acetylglucosaminyltransferase n=1 Tax=Galdieria sulphuraria TaxID=130081 RepID=M2Y5J8_GALSU|nr:alpha-1,6-mannosyl-glycoprotein beta-1,2-N-acetylglucosaminyltransferase [Galdieria sulphuraria]EME31129.1 alpha-1,6-mannosyl-glycoprotein beta-1,2-N-acetylglucosaminyltransferase [Galdieria sulphuraria]|eukprot:XP_005707649.1 alpha-1,6-mannosyl-glycoprotein beta-1,2-N-acetylglucosaminyltransferase [Galdieria sulphuraria]
MLIITLQLIFFSVHYSSFRKKSLELKSLNHRTFPVDFLECLNGSVYEYFEKYQLKFDVSKERHNHRELLRIRELFPAVRGIIPVVILMGDRVQYIETMLETLWDSLGSQEVPIIFSRTSTNESIANLYSQYAFSQKYTLFFPVDMEDSFHPRFRLKLHWFWVLFTIFKLVNFQDSFSHALVLEDDLVVSRDFYKTGKSLVTIAKLLQTKGITVRDINLYNHRSIHSECSFNDVELTPTFESCGYLISRDTFEAIWNNVDIFVKFEDGWDWSVRLLRVLGIIPRYNLQPCISRTLHIGEIGMHTNPTLYEESEYASVTISNGTAINWKEYNLLKYNRSEEKFVYSKCYDEQQFGGITGPFASQQLEPSLILSS